MGVLSRLYRSRISPGSALIGAVVWFALCGLLAIVPLAASEQASVPVLVLPNTAPESVPKDSKVLWIRHVSEQKAVAALSQVSAPVSVVLDHVDQIGNSLLVALSAYAECLRELELIDCVVPDSTHLLKVLTSLTALHSLNVRNQHLGWSYGIGDGWSIWAQNVAVTDWGWLRAARYPRLTDLELCSNLCEHDAAFAMVLMEQWPRRVPTLSHVRVVPRVTSATAILVEKTPSLQSIELRWTGDGIEGDASAAVKSLLCRVRAATLINPPIWEDLDAPLSFDSVRGRVWQGVAESSTLKEITITGIDVEWQLAALMQNRSLALVRNNAAYNKWTQEFARRMILETTVSRFDFGFGPLDYLRGVPDERLAEIYIESGVPEQHTFAREGWPTSLLIRSAEDLRSLFKTRPTGQLALTFAGDVWRDGKKITDEEFAALDAALADGLKSWSDTLTTLSLEKFPSVPALAAQVVKELPNLEFLTLPIIGGSVWTSGVKLPTLRNLRVERVEEAQAFAGLLRQLPSLRELEIGQVAQNDLDPSAMIQLTQLERAVIGLTGDGSFVVEALLKIPALKHVELYGEGRFTVSGLKKEAIKANPTSIVIDIYDDGSGTKRDPIILKELMPSLRRIQLRYLDVGEIPEVVDYFAKHPEVDLGEVAYLRARYNKSDD